MYRGYTFTGNADPNVAGIIENCIKILFASHSRKKCIETKSIGARGIGRCEGLGEYSARKVYVDMCSVYEDIELHITPELLLNSGVEVQLRDVALKYLAEMMSFWEEKYGKHFNAVEQTDASPSHPSTSGLGSTASRIGGSQASYTLPHDPGHMPDSDVQPSTSYAQPSTLAEASSALQEAQVASHRSRTPSNDDLEPPSKRSRSV
ncbi:HGE-14 family type IV secretion system effector [Anaplasma phagocytophilum]|uniref:HGE-14 family type IV secretion system effector n=1 Tax=Anaplasma phagocytophilum TaxID=948 RepID=UPI00200D8C78|nr:hypothetical protein [Anaplasma phagocytophilum]UQD53988.1 hypothetical protein ESP60_00585 [Anaplasma phagocytophilum]